MLVLVLYSGIKVRRKNYTTGAQYRCSLILNLKHSYWFTYGVCYILLHYRQATDVVKKMRELHMNCINYATQAPVLQ